MCKRIEIPPKEPNETAVIDGVEMTGPSDVLAQFKQQRDRHRAAVEAARPALAKLVEVMRHGTGQSYHLRALLFSLWNGKPASLLDVVHLDPELRQALGLVIQAWGLGSRNWEFFYDAMKAAINGAGIWDWFLEESENIKPLEDYVNAANANRS